MREPILDVTGLCGGYPGIPILRDLTFTVPPGQISVLSGPNGAGKTTLIHALAGHLRSTSGRIRFNCADITRLPAHARARLGIGLVPQGRRLFADLTTAEHLQLAARHRRDITDVLELLPALGRRLTHRPHQMSGGEQQMLAIARAVLTRPAMLLLDEPCEGLATPVAATVLELLTRLAADGIATLIAEPNATPTSDGFAATTSRLHLHRGQLTPGVKRVLGTGPGWQS